MRYRECDSNPALPPIIWHKTVSDRYGYRFPRGTFPSRRRPSMLHRSQFSASIRLAGQSIPHVRNAVAVEVKVGVSPSLRVAVAFVQAHLSLDRACAGLDIFCVPAYTEKRAQSWLYSHRAYHCHNHSRRFGRDSSAHVRELEGRCPVGKNAGHACRSSI